MSRTFRKNKLGDVYPDGKKKKQRFYCNCWLCTGHSKEDIQKHKEKIADQEIEKAVKGDDFFFGSWYEGMQGEKVLEEYWDTQWELDELSDQIMREAA